MIIVPLYKRAVCTVAFVITCLATVTCDNTPVDPRITVTIEPTKSWPVSIAVTDTTTLEVRVLSAENAILTDFEIQWQSSDSAVLQVTESAPTGEDPRLAFANEMRVLVTARRAGTALITASVQHPAFRPAETSAEINVTPWALHEGDATWPDSMAVSDTAVVMIAIPNVDTTHAHTLRTVWQSSDPAKLRLDGLLAPDNATRREILDAKRTAIATVLDTGVVTLRVTIDLEGFEQAVYIKTLHARPTAISFADGLPWTNVMSVADTETVVVKITNFRGDVNRLLHVEWRSSNESVLTVRKIQPNGNMGDSLQAQLRAQVVAEARGSAEISVTVGEDGGYRATLEDSVNVLERWRSVSAGYRHTCGITHHQEAYCWGQGLLGNGSATGSSTPVRVNSALQFDSISAGDGHTCGLLEDGTATCWGKNNFGAVGNGTQVDQAFPTPVTTVAFNAVSAAQAYTCATTVNNQAYCWGTNSFGRLGSAGMDSSFVPPRPDPPFDNCARFTGQIDCGLTPLLVRSINRETLPITAIGPGDQHTCAIFSDGHAACWGDYPRLGNDTLAPGPTAIDVRESADFGSVSSGSFHSCVTTSQGSQARCWGYNFYGQLGTAAPLSTCSGLSCSDTAVVVAGGLVFEQVDAGGSTTCGISTTTAAQCWGSNEFGQLGNDVVTESSDCVGGVPCSLEPIDVLIPDAASIRSVSVGLQHACAVTSQGAAYCWGDATDGKLGNGSSSGVHPVPVRVSEPPNPIPRPPQEIRR